MKEILLFFYQSRFHDRDHPRYRSGGQYSNTLVPTPVPIRIKQRNVCLFAPTHGLLTFVRPPTLPKPQIPYPGIPISSHPSLFPPTPAREIVILGKENGPFMPSRQRPKTPEPTDMKNGCPLFTVLQTTTHLL
jgi:hypothetical protein